jgi:hypothetical protein
METALAEHDTTYGISPYSKGLPRRLRLGASRYLGNWLVALDLRQGLESRAGVTTQPALSAGAEFRALAWLHPRAGICLGAGTQAGIAGGLGWRIGPWRLDLAAVNRGGLWPQNTKGLALAAGSSLVF